VLATVKNLVVAAAEKVERVPKKNGADAVPELNTAPEELRNSRNGHG
jgi:hypothetical protein